MSSFTSELKVEPLSDGNNWRLLQPFSYHVGSKYSKNTIKVPKRFVTDFASIPQFIIAILGLVCLFAGHICNNVWLLIFGVVAILAASLMPNWGKYGKSSVVHDYLYYSKMFTRNISDGIFLEAMKVSSVNYIERYAMYYAVRIFGWITWKKGNRKNAL